MRHQKMLLRSGHRIMFLRWFWQCSICDIQGYHQPYLGYFVLNGKKPVAPPIKSEWTEHYQNWTWYSWGLKKHELFIILFPQVSICKILFHFRWWNTEVCKTVKWCHDLDIGQKSERLPLLQNYNFSKCVI